MGFNLLLGWENRETSPNTSFQGECRRFSQMVWVFWFSWAPLPGIGYRDINPPHGLYVAYGSPFWFFWSPIRWGTMYGPVVHAHVLVIYLLILHDIWQNMPIVSKIPRPLTQHRPWKSLDLWKFGTESVRFAVSIPQLANPNSWGMVGDGISTEVRRVTSKIKSIPILSINFRANTYYYCLKNTPLFFGLSNALK